MVFELFKMTFTKGTVSPLMALVTVPETVVWAKLAAQSTSINPMNSCFIDF